ncbi:type 1 glutamine amidotransferase domain-containing protein [Oceanimonas sp. MB9]|uniref:type 1 glutamine amidotransferase domain-containing protein n=1 Tax=Oceanimonas sp. MB9 TaxID=2588453 RepID=UPI0013F62245|nr:type 1 glutamine amidotransferase domain-containing protein [Oceanimonas sp. MB9]NHI00222.1 Molecular chaperone Hsp31 and glyoxalase 3 [Oceanimonas sp. MB9]
MRKFFTLLATLFFVSYTTLASAAPRVLIVVTSHDQMGNTDEKTGLWLAEMTHPYHELKQAGIDVDIASIKGGAAPIDPRSLADDDAINHEFMASPATRTLLDNTLALGDVNPEQYQAILFAGGHGSVWDFPKSDAVNRIGAAIYEQGGYVAAVCHGPAALLNIVDQDGNPIIAGKKVAGFSNVEEAAIELTEVVPYLLQDELSRLGGIYQEGGKFEPFVVQDGRLITGQNPQSAAKLGQVMAQALSANM